MRWTKTSRCTCGGQSMASHGGAPGCSRESIERNRSRGSVDLPSKATALRRCRMTARASGGAFRSGAPVAVVDDPVDGTTRDDGGPGGDGDVDANAAPPGEPWSFRVARAA